MPWCHTIGTPSTQVSWRRWQRPGDSDRARNNTFRSGGRKRCTCHLETGSEPLADGWERSLGCMAKALCPTHHYISLYFRFCRLAMWGKCWWGSLSCRWGEVLHGARWCGLRSSGGGSPESPHLAKRQNIKYSSLRATPWWWSTNTANACTTCFLYNHDIWLCSLRWAPQSFWALAGGHDAAGTLQYIEEYVSWLECALMTILQSRYACEGHV